MSLGSSVGSIPCKYGWYWGCKSVVLYSSLPNLKSACKKFARRYDMDRKPHQYHVGDTVVYCLNLASNKTQNIKGKLLLRWFKPI